MIVVDSSAVVDLVLRTARSDAVELHLLGQAASLHAPELLDYEIWPESLDPVLVHAVDVWPRGLRLADDPVPIGDQTSELLSAGELSVGDAEDP